jgi:nucleoside-diphosphate-sugar epimerase
LKVLVTGVAGFVGGNVVKGFLDAGHSVLAIYRHTLPNFTHQNLKLLKNNELYLLNSVSDIELVVDCAADIPNKLNDGRKLYQQNLESMIQILDFSTKNNIKKIIYMSSMAAFGEINCKVVSALSADRTRNQYGESKAMCENLLKKWSQEGEGRSSFAIRLPGVVGKNSHNNFISDLFLNIQKVTEIIIYNKTAFFNNIVHIETLVTFIFILGGTKNIGYEKLLVASTFPISIEKIVFQIQKKIGKALKIRWEEKGMPFLINFKLAESFGFIPLSTEQAIEKFILEQINSN